MADKVFNFLINYFSNINDRGVDEMNNFRGDITSDEIVEWLKKVQNITSEQPSEDLEYLATSLEETIGTSPHSRETIISYLQKAANWQKEQDKAVIERAEDHAKLAGIALGEKEAKEKFINKACEWLNKNVVEYHPRTGGGVKACC